MKKIVLIVAALAALAGTASAETWICYDDVTRSREYFRIIIEGEVDVDGYQVATIEINDRNLYGVASYQGLNRRISFGSNKELEAFDFSILIYAGGNANYYDFTTAKRGSNGHRLADPSSHFYCNRQ